MPPQRSASIPSPRRSIRSSVASSSAGAGGANARCLAGRGLGSCVAAYWPPDAAPFAADCLGGSPTCPGKRGVVTICGARGVPMEAALKRATRRAGHASQISTDMAAGLHSSPSAHSGAGSCTGTANECSSSRNASRAESSGADPPALHGFLHARGPAWPRCSRRPRGFEELGDRDAEGVGQVEQHQERGSSAYVPRSGRAGAAGTDAAALARAVVAARNQQVEGGSAKPTTSGHVRG